ncbi:MULTISPECIES: PAS domain-containing sensor histidine kinase [unclassified Neisseria]|uniref:sensor histidine kinase n=1 Tax=unclassified Neisseria TaxID=2623750 RepID=UPI002665C009|nr:MULTISPECIES: PAS domain-containing sensor histidine kinase [unclassified Neisseria]MDO1510654.1 PAS domain-containing sensor histidine kinase [Neisseria sp. MVDL19-042950]MDO1516944.1 PAS domain-containing sensor histidine kinase [Neisseria sp. MVDL18-041461]MDO1564306.1 PAS domain-containing sensor histidine kinase [Neisseria sp. MVDL20-010259]
MRSFLLVAGLLAVVFLYTLTVATGYTSSLGDYFWWIIAACAVLIGLLLAVLLRYLWLLLRDSRRRIFGSQIARRLAGMFTLVAVLPGLFLFGVSAQFISNSINSWFGNDTHEALERGLNLSKSALNLALDNAVRNATPIQVDLISTASLGNSLHKALTSSPHAKEFTQLAIYDFNSKRSNVVRNPRKLPPPVLDDATREVLEQSGSARDIENLNNILYAQGWLMLDSRQNQRRALFFRQPIPENVAKDATLIEAARAKYAELSYAKQGLQTFFLVTLLVATLLAIMLALVMALYFARRFVEPVLSLAEGARAVAQGDFSQKRPIFRNDEFGRLTHLFNHMTEQLGIAQAASERNRQQQEAARHYLECVLESLTTGVITLDDTGRLKTYNKSAERILGITLENLIGSNWYDWPKQEPQQAVLAETFAAIVDTALADKPVQLSYAAPDDARILLAKATLLPDDNDNGIVMVFDDITALVRAQKEAAWGEVAKRLAHEIRNPLTPIQLSAERLAWKLHDKLAEQDAQILTRSTDTIIKQVAALKEMVEAFRNYARAPSLKLERHDLNKIVEEVLLLYEGSKCTFTADLSNIPIFIAADTTAMRQVLHNIFKNASEAAEDAPSPHVQVNTRQSDDGQAVLIVSNNGKSFSKEMLHHAFEPYVTDKPTGTGLGLPVVKKIIEEHGGRISLSNPAEGGACVRIVLPELVEAYAQ